MRRDLNALSCHHCLTAGMLHHHNWHNNNDNDPDDIVILLHQTTTVTSGPPHGKFNHDNDEENVLLSRFCIILRLSCVCVAAHDVTGAAAAG